MMRGMNVHGLHLYEKCEPKLRDEIAAGDRRTYRAERGWLEYTLTTPERPAMASACAENLAALRQRCR